MSKKNLTSQKVISKAVKINNHNLNEAFYPTNCKILFYRLHGIVKLMHDNAYTCYYFHSVVLYFFYQREKQNKNAYAHYCVSPSTISSESSTKNSLSGGLFGRLSVFNSCWILVDTLLLTGTPGQTSRTVTVTHIWKQRAKRTCTPTCTSILAQFSA